MTTQLPKEERDDPPKLSEYETEWSKRGYEPHIATLLAKADWSQDMINWQEDEIERQRTELLDIAEQYTNYHNWAQGEIARLERDVARLDSDTIRIPGRDEFGEPTACIHKGLDLRVAIDAAIEESH